MSNPRPFILADERELDRLLRETLGYAQVSLHNKDGTDLEGRQYACWALKEAISKGYRLAKVTP